MSFTDGLLIFFAILFSYFILVIFLHKRGILKKYNISLYGPGLLIRTKKGRGFLKKIARIKRFWKAYGNFAIVFTLIVMILMVIFFVWQFSVLINLDLTAEQKAELPGPEFALILPGINPLIPIDYLFYVIFAFIIAIIVHEFSHGILTYASDLKVKAMGILYLVIPMGAFVEPDEEQLKKTKISKRMRIFAAGPLGNFVVVLVCLSLFSLVFMSSVHAGNGLTVYEIYEDSPAYEAGIRRGAIITSVNETDLASYLNISARFLQYKTIENSTNANDTISLSYIQNGVTYSKDIVLTDKHNYYFENSTKGKGYIGIYSFVNEEGNLGRLQNIPQSTSDLVYYISVPIMSYFDGYNPLSAPFTEAYIIKGPLSVIPTDVFWFIVNSLYWIFWLNLMVGLFNVLPMIPLDGGFLFNDYIRVSAKKIKKELSKEDLDKIVKNVSLVVSLTILFLILFPFLLKYI